VVLRDDSEVVEREDADVVLKLLSEVVDKLLSEVVDSEDSDVVERLLTLVVDFEEGELSEESDEGEDNEDAELGDDSELGELSELWLVEVRPLDERSDTLVEERRELSLSLVVLSLRLTEVVTLCDVSVDKLVVDSEEENDELDSLLD